MTDVACLGAVNIDLIAKVDHFPRADEGLLVEEMQMHAGGSAANVAVGISRLGHSASFLGVMGTDHHATFLKDEFLRERVDLSKTLILDGNNGMVIVLVNSNGDRSLVTIHGVGQLLEPEQVPYEAIDQSKFLFLSNLHGPHVLEAYTQAAAYARQRDAGVVFDPGAFFSSQGLKRMEQLLAYCDIVLPSENDLQIMTGKTGEEGARKLLGYGPELVVVTCGDRGCLYVTDDDVQELKNPSMDVPVVDTTGAGSSFSAGILSGLLQHMQPLDAVKHALLVARLSCGRTGARSTPTYQELKQYL